LLADKIMEVIKSDAGILESTKVNAMKHVKNDFNLDKQNREFAEFYNSYIEPSNSNQETSLVND